MADGRSSRGSSGSRGSTLPCPAELALATAEDRAGTVEAAFEDAFMGVAPGRFNAALLAAATLGRERLRPLPGSDLRFAMPLVAKV